MGRSRLSRVLVLVVAGLGLGIRLSSASEDTGLLTLQVENDRVAGTDRAYTNGLRIAYLTPEIAADESPRRWLDKVSVLPSRERLRIEYALGQSIFTPEDTKRRDLIVDDRPYAAWLYVGAALIAYDESPGSLRRMETLALELGVVGPWALGEEVQNGFHDHIGVSRAEGWSNQLRDEPGLVLSYEHKWRSLWEPPEIYGIGVEIMPHVGGALGNVMTFGQVGASLRIGANLPDDFGPPRIRPGMPGSGYFKGRPDRLGIYVFGGAEARAVLRNIFLDGNTFRDSHSVDRAPLVYDLQAGLALTYDRWRLSYTHVYRSPEIEGQISGDRFGAVALSWHLPF